MLSPVAYPHIQKLNDRPACLKRLPRIRVAQIVMDYLAHGWSVDEICRQHTYLVPAEVHSAMAYYFDHPAEIETEIQHEVQRIKQLRSTAAPSSFLTRMRAEGKL
jgi:uncharacterized protein (DUF433 family)